jgi:uncharacterized protein YfaS (alpha-2-macroglobulin family)
MSTTPSQGRGRLAFLHRFHFKDVLLAVFVLFSMAMSAYAFREPLAAFAARLRAQRGETVSVFNVIVDRERRAYVDVLFDRPLGAGLQGTVLDPPPATITPTLRGAWKWQDSNALRFTPSGKLPVASEYTFSLLPERLLKPGQVFTGKTELKVVTDRFLVEGVSFEEEPALEGRGRVFFKGALHFNYRVDPALLATKISLLDPDRPISLPATAPGSPKVEVVTDWQSKEFELRTTPVEKGRTERKLRLVIAADLTPVEGNVPLGEDYQADVTVGSRAKLAVWGVVAEPGLKESALRIKFSSPVSAAVAAKYVTLQPPAEVRFSADKNLLSATGDIKPGQSYTLTIEKGLPAADEAVLAETFRQGVDVPDLPASVDFQSQGMFLWASGQHSVALESVNVPKVKLSIDRVYLNNLFFLFEYGSSSYDDYDYGYRSNLNHALGDRLKEATITVGGARNRPVVTRLKLDRWVDTKKPGLYRVLVGGGDTEERTRQRWLLLTDLGVVAKRGSGELLVWVSSLRDLAAMGGAKVTVVSDQNQILAEGSTDAAGMWRLRDAKALGKGRPYLVTVEKGSDFTFLRLDSMLVDTTGLDVSGAPGVGRAGGREAGAGYQAYLYGERNLYRPGEQLKGVAVVRDGSLATPPAMPLLLRWLDPQGRERATRKLSTDARGTAEIQLDLPAYTLTGHHNLELKVAEKVIGQYAFQVEEFVPDRIKVEIAAPKERVGPGQELRYEVASSYLFGPPAAGLPVESRVRLVDATFHPKGWEGWSFRNAERKLDDREVLAASDTLDAAGRHSFKVAMPADVPVPSTLEAVLTARVQEQGGRGVAALTRVPIHPYPAYLGLRQVEEGYAQPGQAVAFEYVALTPEGQPVPAGELQAELYRDRWETVLRHNPHGGGYTYESTRDPELAGSQQIAGGKPRGAFSFTPHRFGSYRVVLTDPRTQASTEVELYVSGEGYSPWAVKSPARIELGLDKSEYAPGETAKLQVKAPFSGKLLVSVERDEIFDVQVLALAGNTTTVAIPVRAGLRPNAYVTATLVRPVGDLEPGSVGRAFGALPIAVNRTANRIALKIQAPPEVRPETPLTVTVQSAPGATVTVAAVDEGILQLVAQKTADPFEFFYRKLQLEISSYDTFSLLLPEPKPRRAGGGEGKEGLSQYVRTEGIRRVKPVAFWSGPLRAGADGRVKATFKLPQFQGALRLMAVAADADRFGSAEQLTRVRSPLVVLPTYPRILSFHETLSVPVTVRNDTGRAGAFKVGLAVGGPVQLDPATVAKMRESVAIASGQEKTLYFTVRTGGVPGEARFDASAEGNGERTHASESVGVRADLPPASAGESGVVAASTLRLPFAGAERYRPETVTRELRLGPLPLVQFGGQLRDLLHYPYGCLEQTVSTGMPLIYLGDLARRLDPEILDPKKGFDDPAVLVQAALRRAAGMQLWSGAFSLWPGGDHPHLWASIYATHFMVEAKRAGHPVEGSVFKNALNWLAGSAKAKTEYGSDELERTAYSLYVLARAGRADLGTMDYLRAKQAKHLAVDSRALLAAAYAAAGNPKATGELVATLGEVETVERQTGENFRSTIRTRALLLLALLDAAPASPRIPALVDRLARDVRENPWWTTQEQAFALLALGQLYRRQGEMPAYSGTVYLGERKVGSFDNQTVTFAGLPGTAPLRIEMAPGWKPGAPFYSLTVRGIPSDQSFKPESAGLEIERDYLNREGGALDLGGVKQGDLIAVRTRVRSVSGAVQNVVVVNLLPSGLEVENPRLETTEQLPWVKDANLKPDYLDLRDDRILVFLDLPSGQWQTFYSLVRAVAPGTFRLPPVQAEAMYNPSLRGTGARGEITVKTRQ